MKGTTASPSPEAEEYQAEACSNPRGQQHPIGEIVAARLSRREALQGMLGGIAGGAVGSALGAHDAEAASPSSLRFTELTLGLDETHHVAEGYEAQVLIRWGDPVLPGAPAFDPQKLTGAAQEKQLGYNCDFLAFFPLPAGSRNGEHGLLTVNHEYINSNLVFPGLGPDEKAGVKTNREQAEVEVAAHGLSIIEVRKGASGWSVVEGSRYARRITAATPMTISGPAAGDAKLQTAADPTGRHVLGMFANCAGGVTPWGTLLTCEENVHFYFAGDLEKLPHKELYERYAIGKPCLYSWPRHFDRFNLDKEPNEPNRFGWVVEIDPYDPNFTPVKRTALGRFKHECATCVVAPDGRVVVYQGDDERREYVYKFVTARPYTPNDRAANANLLDEGTLYVAQFLADGSLKWLPLVHGEGPLTAENGFASQADVLINARGAADAVKATPMDRPEDVETNPVTGRVYVMLTNNSRRKPEEVDAANPRARNAHGHIIEIIPPMKDGKPDHTATEAKWDIFLLGGKPGIDPGARYHRLTSDNGWLSCPDNCTFDSKGRIWIATDGGPANAGIADGIWAADTTGNGRALTRLFFQAPTGAEVCGPCFTPDEQTLFLSVQHPGEDRGSTFDKPSTRWPDFKPDVPPRPSVIAITKKGGGVIGS